MDGYWVKTESYHCLWNLIWTPLYRLTWKFSFRGFCECTKERGPRVIPFPQTQRIYLLNRKKKINENVIEERHLTDDWHFWMTAMPKLICDQMLWSILLRINFRRGVSVMRILPVSAVYAESLEFVILSLQDKTGQTDLLFLDPLEN